MTKKIQIEQYEFPLYYWLLLLVAKVNYPNQMDGNLKQIYTAQIECRKHQIPKLPNSHLVLGAKFGR